MISQLVQNGRVLEHPDVQQHQQIPEIEQDTHLNLVIQPTLQNPSPSDPNAPIDHHHALSPLATRASHAEQAMIHGSKTVSATC